MASRWQGFSEYLSQAVTFTQEAWAELRRVQWPSRKETRTATVVVILVVGVVTAFLFLVDATLSRLLRTFLSS